MWGIPTRAVGQKVLQSVVKCCIDPAGAIKNAVCWVQQSLQQTISCCMARPVHRARKDVAGVEWFIRWFGELLSTRP